MKGKGRLTPLEWVLLIAFLVIFFFLCGGVYVIGHFIMKFW